MNTAVAEKAVIGIMLIEPDRQSEAFKSLTAQMFSIKDLGDIFLLCKELDRRGERADGKLFPPPPASWWPRMATVPRRAP